MPRGPQILTPQQQALLRAAREAHLAFQAAERQAQAEYDLLMSKRTQAERATLARAVLDAVNYGVPKSRINQEVLGTSTPNAWQRWVDLARAFVSDQPAPQTTLPPQFAEPVLPTPERIDGTPDWPLPISLRSHEHAGHLSFMGDPRDRRLRVSWPGYPSTAPDAPATLEGVVAYSPEHPSGWQVEHDPQDKQTPFGVETGAFTFEVQQRRGASPIRDALSDFLAAADLPPLDDGGDPDF